MSISNYNKIKDVLSSRSIPIESKYDQRDSSEHRDESQYHLSGEVTDYGVVKPLIPLSSINAQSIHLHPAAIILREKKNARANRTEFVDLAWVPASASISYLPREPIVHQPCGFENAV